MQKFNHQPTLEELKDSKVYLEYIVNTSLPLEGLKQMTYYTSVSIRDGIYFLRNYNRPISMGILGAKISEGIVIKLEIKIPLQTH